MPTATSEAALTAHLPRQINAPSVVPETLLKAANPPPGPPKSRARTRGRASSNRAKRQRRANATADEDASARRPRLTILDLPKTTAGFYSKAQICAMIGWSPMTLYRRCQAREFVQSVSLGPNRVGFPRGLVDLWIESKTKEAANVPAP